MRRFLRDNALSLSLFGLFAIAVVGQALTGWRAQAEELRQHGEAALTFLAYLGTGHFLSSLFENWESEFLQMAVYVLLTALLTQRGSPESHDPDAKDDPEDRPVTPDSPWPVHRGGLLLRLYSHSLSIALTALFVLSFALHLLFSARHAGEEALRHHQPPPGVAETLADPQFWFESFQNWQSEFLSMAVLIVLGIYLRERGSAESKPVAAPHAETGGGG